MTSNLDIQALLAEAQREVGRFEWGGTFADYLRMVSENPSVSRLSHRLIYDTIINEISGRILNSKVCKMEQTRA